MTLRTLTRNVAVAASLGIAGQAAAVDTLIYSLAAPPQGIWEVDIDGTGTPNLLSDLSLQETGLDVDYENELIYVGGGNIRSIGTAPLTGGAGSVLGNSLALGETFDVVADAANGRYFYTSDVSSGGLYVAATDGSGFNTRIPGNYGSLHGLDYDPASDTLYAAAQRDAQIWAINADGSGDTLLYDAADGVLGPRGLAIDVASNRVFWAQFGNPTGPGQIVSAPLDGSDTPEVLYDIVAGGWLPHSLILDPFTDTLYWTEFIPSSATDSRIVAASADGMGAPTILYDNLGSRIRGIEFGQQPIPEPSTNALLGLSLLGLALYKRRK